MRKLITVFLIALSLCVHGQTYKTVTGVLNDSTTILRAGTYSADLDNRYAQIQDGLISGGEATIGTGSVTIDTALYRINKVNYTSLPRTFTGIANSPSGTQYYLVVYGEIGGTLDTISGARDTIAVIPSIPVNTVKINTILVGDGGVESATPDLSGYAKLLGGNIFEGNQIINGFLSANNNFYRTNRGILFYDRGVNPSLPLGISPGQEYPSFDFKRYAGFDNELTLVSYPIVGSVIQEKYPISFRKDNGFVSIGGFNANYQLDVRGDINTNSAFRINGAAYTVASNSNSGFLTSTDWSLFNGKESALAFSTPLSRSVNTISVNNATTSTTGVASFNSTNFTVTTGAVNTIQNINNNATPQFNRLGLGSAASASTALLLPAGTATISSLRLPNGVAPTSPVAGDTWRLTTGVRMQTYDGANTKDFIFDKTNFQFVGTGVRAVTTNPTGDLAATTPILETFTTDTDVITAITGGTYNKNSTFSDTISPASSKVFYKGQMYKSSTYLYVATNDNVSFRTALDGSTTGWATYVDNAYTVGSPFAIASGVTSTLPNNAASSIANNLPIGVTSFYNSGTSKIIPASLGDTYNFAIRFKAKTTATTDFLDFGIDIGGAIGVVFKESKVFLKGANTEMDFVFTVPAYVQSTFLANGGLIKITAHTGDLSIYDIVFDIIRTGKGIQ